MPQKPHGRWKRRGKSCTVNCTKTRMKVTNLLHAFLIIQQQTGETLPSQGKRRSCSTTADKNTSKSHALSYKMLNTGLAFSSKHYSFCDILYNSTTLKHVMVIALCNIRLLSINSCLFAPHPISPSTLQTHRIDPCKWLSGLISFLNDWQ